MDGFMMTNYGQKREVNATDGELKIFQFIRDVVAEAGMDPDLLELCRKSNSYVSAAIGSHDIVRFKWSERTAWIKLPYSADGNDRRPFYMIQDLEPYRREILGHYFLALGSHLIYDVE